MPAYGNIDRAIPGLVAEELQTKKSIRTRSAKQEIEFGAPVMGYLGDEVSGYNYALDMNTIVWDADFVTSNSILVTVNGVSAGAVVFATDHDTTMGLVLAAVTALTITDSVLGTVQVDASLDAGDANNRTLFIRAKGLEVTVTEAVTLGATQATGTITAQTDQVFIGISVYTAKNVSSANNAKYFVNDTVNVMETGIIWAYVNSPVVADAVAYLDNAGSDKGRFAAAGDAVGAFFRDNTYTNSTTGDVLGMVQTTQLTKPNAVITWS